MQFGTLLLVAISPVLPLTGNRAIAGNFAGATVLDLALGQQFRTVCIAALRQHHELCLALA